KKAPSADRQRVPVGRMPTSARVPCQRFAIPLVNNYHTDSYMVSARLAPGGGTWYGPCLYPGPSGRQRVSHTTTRASEVDAGDPIAERRRRAGRAGAGEGGCGTEEVRATCRRPVRLPSAAPGLEGASQDPRGDVRAAGEVARGV